MGTDQRKSLTSDLICRKGSVMKKEHFLHIKGIKRELSDDDRENYT